MDRAVNAMNPPMPKICVLTATPLVVHFFLKPHLLALSRHFDVTLACNPKNDAYLPLLELPVHQTAVGMERKISPLRDLMTLFELYRLFRRERFDLVVSVVPKAGLLGMVAAALAGVKCRVHIFQGEVWASRRGLMRGFLKSMDRVIAKSASHVLAVSQSERQFLEEQGVTRLGQVRVLGSGSISGVDMVRFQPDPESRSDLRKAHDIPDDAVVCLFLGRLTADKGVFDLVRAFSLCGEINSKLWLVLVGPDEEGVGPRLHSIPRGEAAGRMLVEGFTHTPERYIAAADFLCLPSYREGFGMVVIEAAAVGIPSVGSRIYGVSDAIVENETGLLVPPGDVPRLAEALSRLAEDGALRTRLALAGRARVEKEFKQENVVPGYVDYFLGLLNRQSSEATR
jgi:glycosyltransferase involved in cell wall biosynthesis